MPNSVSNGKHKINFLDFLLIIMIIAIISAAIVSVIRSNPNQISGGDTTLTYKIRCEMVNQAVAENIKLNDTIYDNNTNQLLGNVLSIEKTPITALDPSQSTSENPKGEITTDKVTLTLLISAKAWNDNGLYSIDSYRIAAGQTIYFHSEELSLSGLCISVTPQ